MSEALGKVLREARKRMSLPQQKVALRVGVSRAAVGQWELGETEPSTDNLIRICEALGIELQAATAGQLVNVSGFKAVEIKHQEGLAERTIEQINAMDRHPFNQPDYFLKKKLIPFYASHNVHGDANTYITEEPLFFAPRAPDAPATNDAYILGVMNDSLSPFIKKMSMVYVDGRSIPTVGEYVLVRYNHYFKKSAGAALKAHGMQTGIMGRLESFNAGSVTIQQFNPAGLHHVSLNDVVALHRIMPAD